MRPVKVYMNAAGYSQWVPIDYIESWFGVGVSVIPSYNATVSYSVQYHYNPEVIDPARSPQNKISISRSTTTATVTDYGPQGLGHGLTAGDSVIIKGSGSAALDSQKPQFGNGDLGITVTPTAYNTYTYTCANSGPAADGGNAYVARQRIYTHSTLVTQSTRQNGTFNYPVRGVRLYLISITGANSYIDMTVLQGSSA